MSSSDRARKREAAKVRDGERTISLGDGLVRQLMVAAIVEGHAASGRLAVGEAHIMPTGDRRRGER